MEEDQGQGTENLTNTESGQAMYKDKTLEQAIVDGDVNSDGSEKELIENIEEKSTDENEIVNGEGTEHSEDSNSEIQDEEKDEEKEEEMKLVKRQGTVTYKTKGKNIGMPIETDVNAGRGMGAGRIKRKNKKK